MKDLFFTEDGLLNINKTIMSQPSYLKIMNDGVVTEDELIAQSEKVVSLFRKIDDAFNEEQKKLVERVIVESSILNMVYKIYEMNNTMAKDLSDILE